VDTITDTVDTITDIVDTITDITDLYPIQGTLDGNQVKDQEVTQQDEDWLHDQEPSEEDEDWSDPLASKQYEDWLHDQEPIQEVSSGRGNGIQHESLAQGQSLKDWIQGVKRFADLKSVAASLGIETHDRGGRVFIKCDHPGEGIHPVHWSCLLGGREKYEKRWSCFACGAQGDVFDFVEHFGPDG
jgi:hypothetical protein